MFSSAVFRNVSFTDCYLVYSCMNDCSMQKVSFSKCNLSESDFSSVRHKGLAIMDSNMERASLSATMFKDMDLSGSTLASVFMSESFRELRGAQLDVSQAMDIVRLFGVKVK